MKYVVRVRWEPFLIHPNCPLEGIPVEGPIGGDLANPRYLHLKETGKSLGIDFNFTCPVYPNTVPSHVFLDYAKTVKDGALQNEIMERLFRAYFTKGRPLEKRHLLKIAQDVGLNIQAVSKYLDNPDNEEKIRVKAAQWRKQGVQAIPFIFINGQPSCSGSQETQAFIETIEKVVTKYPSCESSV